ncbi:centrosome and spindle pole associated protein 1-like isoform X4 [Dreissena polymorpha]|uniref:centrosome and spindle pole associated protein 1-like isoform X4 n=1 Tax=Dreissena polymorpha TaxID=45954 RepID=UPI0022641116|nr:centrosome and spindle pole associated protein 1-like isoform X4 [Dreissena polymorpha]
MGTLVETDIDQFIKGHKQKLQEERNHLNSYPAQVRNLGQPATSPTGRKQWNKNEAQQARPAEEARDPPQPQETGLPLDYDSQDKKKQQLNADRQREYNELQAKEGPVRGRRPRTPSNEGLPLGQYEQKRKALEQERNAEMKQALAAKLNRGNKVFDYKEAEKAHLAEKKKEYNDFLQRKAQASRHIVTPEDGMFVGPDQSERDKAVREKNAAYKQELEKQQREKLLYKARQMGHIPDLTAQGQKLKLSGPPHKLYDERPHPSAPQRSIQGQGYQIKERVMDMPHVSPRRDLDPQQQQPVFLENGDVHDEGHRHGNDERLFERRGRPSERHDPSHQRGRSLDEKEKYQWYNENKLSPPLDVRRSRSFSPPIERHRSSQNAVLKDLEKRQLILQEEYRRQVAEDQRLAAAQQGGLPLTDDSPRQRLEEERKREYNEYLAKKGLTDRSRQAEILEGTGATLNVGEYDENRRRQLQEERNREYVEQQQQKQLTDKGRGLPPKPATPNHFFKNIGQHDRLTQVLNEERKKEYNQKLREENVRTGRRLGSDTEQYAAGLPIKGNDSAEVYATLPGLGYSQSAEVRKIKARNEEYNEFLREKQVRDTHRLDHKKPLTAAIGSRSLPPSPKRSPRANPKEYATLPGLHYSDSADKRKMAERNKEYNEFLRQKDRGKKGFTTPTYEEILEQKRREETLRRREEDFDSGNLRRFNSEGNINRVENELRDKVLNKEIESRKVRFDAARQQPAGILEDENWLQPEHRESEYRQLTEPPREEIPEDMAAHVQQPKYLAGLAVGGSPGVLGGSDERESAKRRKQAEYRRELQFQMEETAARKKREKVQELRVNASGLLDPEKSSGRIRGLEGVPGSSPRREYKAKDVQAYHTKFLLDDSQEYDALGRPSWGGVYTSRQGPSHPVSQAGLALGGWGSLGLGREGRGTPQSNPDFGDDLRLDLGGGGRDRGRRRERENPLSLDPGFISLLESRRPVGTAAPPPGLLYQPSNEFSRWQDILDVPSANPLSGTYVTGGGGGLGGAYGNVDEAYHYYGLKNPLDELNTGGGVGYVPGLDLGRDYGGGRSDYVRSPGQRVTFADEPLSSNRARDRSKERIDPYQFPSDDDLKNKSKSGNENYGAELGRQIEEKRRQKAFEKEQQRRYELKLEEDIKNYNPFGRGGGGAPIRDEAGNPIADLRAVQKGTYVSPGRTPRRNSPEGYSPRPPSPRDDKIKPPPPQQSATGEPTFARGGHGIFGMPKTDAEKDQSEKYKDELRNQIAEKRRLQQLEKERERSEEERENRRLEEQRVRMQHEYEEEQKKIKAREEEARRKNEELKRQADDRKKETERKRREVDDEKMREQQEQIERERREREQREKEANDRVKSPPVPAVKGKTNEERGRSPPVPANRKGRDSALSVNSQRTVRSQQASPQPAQSNRPPSSDVLTQLASMRKQLQSERRRVENALENSKNEPDVFDPRTIQRPPPLDFDVRFEQHNWQNKIVFENAMNKNASLPPPRPATDNANARNIQQFNELKYKTDSDSRRALRSMFPEAPVTNTTLETQQEAMLRQQEEQLRNLRGKILTTETERKLLKEDTLTSDVSYEPKYPYIIRDVDNVNYFPEDFEELAGRRNDSARARRRDRHSPRPSSFNAMGSQASLDVDRIQRKNEDRLRRLQQITNTGDDISMADPDDILDRFMARQRYNRPASGQTLQDDSWMRPGSKVV